MISTPVHHRLLGLDRRSFPHALFVVGVFLLATVVVPRIDKAIDWDDSVRAGDLVFTPTSGGTARGRSGGRARPRWSATA